LYKNCFSEINVFILLEYRKNNYIIDLQLDLKLLFEFLYILFEKKLAIFRDYLLKNQISKYIRKFTNRANIPIFFVFKLNKTLRLYNQRLNFVIIKNRYLLFLIKKTLNCLINIYYFIKLNFENIYYCICIRKNNKWKIVFRTRYYLFKYIVMFFDLINISVIFQILINKIL